jgi:hypothetical protein
VLFSASVDDASGGRSVILHYRLGGERGGYRARALQAGSGGRFSTMLRLRDPRRLRNLRFYFEAVDRHGNRGYNGTPDRPYAVD